jgi:hypothetical protein
MVYPPTSMEIKMDYMDMNTGEPRYTVTVRECGKFLGRYRNCKTETVTALCENFTTALRKQAPENAAYFWAAFASTSVRCLRNYAKNNRLSLHEAADILRVA